jgi:hypothetical protein
MKKIFLICVVLLIVISIFYFRKGNGGISQQKILGKKDAPVILFQPILNFKTSTSDFGNRGNTASLSPNNRWFVYAEPMSTNITVYDLVGNKNYILNFEEYNYKDTLRIEKNCWSKDSIFCYLFDVYDTSYVIDTNTDTPFLRKEENKDLLSLENLTCSDCIETENMSTKNQIMSPNNKYTVLFDKSMSSGLILNLRLKVENKKYQLVERDAMFDSSGVFWQSDSKAFYFLMYPYSGYSSTAQPYQLYKGVISAME